MGDQDLAVEAAGIYGRGKGNELPSETSDAFEELDETIQRRLFGDREAQQVLSNLIKKPGHVGYRRALAKQLSYYLDVDSGFSSALTDRVNRLKATQRAGIFG